MLRHVIFGRYFHMTSLSKISENSVFDNIIGVHCGLPNLTPLNSIVILLAYQPTKTYRDVIFRIYTHIRTMGMYDKNYMHGYIYFEMVEQSLDYNIVNTDCLFS